MDNEFGDGKGIHRLAMPSGMVTPSISDIVCRTFVVQTLQLVLALDGERIFFFKFLDEIKSDSKHSKVGKYAAGSVTHCCQIWTYTISKWLRKRRTCVKALLGQPSSCRKVQAQIVRLRL